jgi:hypothetical protein
MPGIPSWRPMIDDGRVQLSKRVIWLGVIGASMLGLGVFFAINGLDRSDKYASVLGALLGTASLGLAIGGAIRRSGVSEEPRDQSPVGGTFYIVNDASGLALTASADTLPGRGVSARKLRGDSLRTDSPQQRWELEQLAATGHVAIRSAPSNLVLDATRARPGGQNLLCEIQTGVPGQQWSVNVNENGSYTIRSRSEALGYLSLNEEAQDGWQPWFKREAETSGQRWRLKRVS